MVKGLTDQQLAEFLNRMLEAERAGARALVVYLDSFERNSEAWTVLRKVHEDEAHNCALIGEQLRKLGRDYSHATGEFFDKAIAVQGAQERIAFLVKGLEWAVRRYAEALPDLPGEPRALCLKMRNSHLRSIAACQRLSGTLPN